MRQLLKMLDIKQQRLMMCEKGKTNKIRHDCLSVGNGEFSDLSAETHKSPGFSGNEGDGVVLQETMIARGYNCRELEKRMLSQKGGSGNKWKYNKSLVMYYASSLSIALSKYER